MVPTELAPDRTQLAWVRTAFTLITAGLAIDKGAVALNHAWALANTNWGSDSGAVGIALSVAGFDRGGPQNSTLYLSVIFLRISAVFSSSMVKTASSFDLSTAVSCFRITDVARERDVPPP